MTKKEVLNVLLLQAQLPHITSTLPLDNVELRRSTRPKNKSPRYLQDYELQKLSK